MRFARRSTASTRAWRSGGTILAASGLIWISACGGGGGSSPVASSPVDTAFGDPGPNVQPIVVDPGPANDYANGVFTSVTVCVPGTTACQTIDGVLVDTGSSGLRLLSSVLSLGLPQVQDASGAPIVECNQFQYSYQWGPLAQADVRIAGEAASAVPIQLIGDPGFSAVPADCSSSGLPAQETVDSLGANGILGVGLWRQDCGPACARAGSTNPGWYYACPASGCLTAAVSLDSQLQNPVWRFATDNNGVAIQLPSIPQAGAPRVDGSLVFGIGTRPNNALGSATVYTVDGVGDITTIFRGQSYSSSFIDSGSNGLYFLDSNTTGLASCQALTGFYCPPSPVSLSATNRGRNGASGNVSFSIVSTETLFRSPNFAFNDLGGPNQGGFDWGLPFFFGRVVFTAIEQQTTPGGAGPYFAY